MYMRMSIAENIKSTIPKTNSVKEFMEVVMSQSDTADKPVARILMGTLTIMKFNGSRTIHEHITKMINIAAKLEIMGLKSIWFIANKLQHYKGQMECNRIMNFAYSKGRKT
ncbi:LOW QUALITY PROTEIN: hypothetical protein RJ641_013058 [Dillenia turbinata]|uniref:UBN2 domain-containing protein n=1 Tax=Dillenia turbinata TaxID=194707 RepID=A0AAN8W9A0_9MAGN